MTTEPVPHAPPTRLETRHLLLRPWTPDDAPALQHVVLNNLGHLQAWMPWATPEAHEHVAEVAERLRGFAADFAAGRDWSYVMLGRVDGALLGALGLHRRGGPDVLEIGYWIRADRSGRGLVTEAVTALADAVLETSGVARLEIRCDPRNEKSAAVARRAGFRHVTTLHGDTTATGEPRDTMVWERRRETPRDTPRETPAPARFDVVALDADDTLWHNESLFTATQTRFRELLAPYHDIEHIDRRLYETETRNLRHFGYGVKGFTLSMIETAIELTEARIGGAEIRQILDLGREMLSAPVELLDGVAETVETLAESYRLVLVTKGDLFDQESKLARSRVGDRFSAVEIVSEKDARTYAAVMARQRVEPARFVMVGNSLRSDVLPALEAGGAAVYIPYHVTWAHEHVDDAALAGKVFAQLESIRDLPAWLARA
jgi:putative hydrolase of the HAD superfamily